MKVKKVKIISNNQVSDRYWHVVVDSSNFTNNIEPGQFFNIKCAEESFPFLRRPFSIYRNNWDEQTIEFLYLIAGEGTKRLTEKKPGDMLDLFGPLGVGFELDPHWDKILLLARGVGIATLAALAQRAHEQNVKSIAILSARSKNDLLATETLQGFGAEVYKVTEEDGTSDVENVERLINEICQEHDIKAGFTCGSRRLSKLMKRTMGERKIPAQIAMEENMGCAMGVCYACVRDIEVNGEIVSKRICLEGPVFDLSKVVM